MPPRPHPRTAARIAPLLASSLLLVLLAPGLRAQVSADDVSPPTRTDPGTGTDADAATRAGTATPPDPGKPWLIPLAWRDHALPPDVQLVEEHNGTILDDAPVFRFDASWVPRLQLLREQERLDEVSGDGDEWTRMRRLARWVYDQWDPERPRVEPPFDALEVLEYARAHGRGFCTQFATVQVQAAAALGWQARYVTLATERSLDTHVSVEMWSNAFDKWVVLDAHFGVFVEHRARPGIPLGAREIHAALGNGTRDALVVRDLGGDQQVHPRPPADFLGYFLHLAVDRRSDHLSGPPDGWSRRETFLSWRDDHTDGRPWIFAHTTERAGHFEPPLNQVELTWLTFREPYASPGLMLAAVRTNMAALDGFEVTIDADAPRRVPLHGELAEDHADFVARHALETASAPARMLDPALGQLLLWSWRPAPGRHALTLQAVNLAGVRGPPARFVVEREP